jgi:hypothetical protein
MTEKYATMFWALRPDTLATIVAELEEAAAMEDVRPHAAEYAAAAKSARYALEANVGDTETLVLVKAARAAL